MKSLKVAVQLSVQIERRDKLNTPRKRPSFIVEKDDDYPNTASLGWVSAVFSRTACIAISFGGGFRTLRPKAQKKSYRSYEKHDGPKAN